MFNQILDTTLSELRAILVPVQSAIDVIETGRADMEAQGFDTDTADLANERKLRRLFEVAAIAIAKARNSDQIANSARHLDTLYTNTQARAGHVTQEADKIRARQAAAEKAAAEYAANERRKQAEAAAYQLETENLRKRLGITV